ncbi:MAG TPA: flagellin [Candidatus Hydrogenedentes bacterium]|nr:flagellin [Candidatus Hydrogenedentota bacterium]HRT19414.1 flagellin [Candidatus Hydrogenedentota bacterium]HRT63852.1 flagellin [Candidatus Hydrogenedentota bacterium]
MGLEINSLNRALGTQRMLADAAAKMQRKQAQLAGGLRITGAKDDAAGLAIAETFRARILQYTQEANNLQTGINVVQTADAALGTQQEAVGRIRELALQAANGALTDEQRSALNQEAQALLGQIEDTARNTEFNGTRLLDGSTGPIAVGTEGGEQIVINAGTTNALGLNGLDLSTQTGAADALERLDNAATALDRNRASLGAQQNRFEQALAVRGTAAQNMQASESLIRDLDIAGAVIEQTRNQMRLMQGTFAQIQGNILPQAAAQLLGAR